MKKLSVKLNTKRPVSYPIMIEQGLLRRLPMLIKKEFPQSRCVVITDHTVRKLYGEKLRKTIGKNAIILSVRPGESSKTQKSKTVLEETLLKLGVSRDSVIIVLGGGVVGDLAGFVAATYMRGIPYVQVPTTLLAMVDSSVGGKTGINTSFGKNTIGAFHQPKMVLIDPEVLTSLPEKEIIHGLVEAVKMFVTNDKAGFIFAEKNIEKAIKKNIPILTEMIARALRIKIKVVSGDELESGKRMVLNFGHTIGHALEKESGYKMAHGKAVALGILVESALHGSDTDRIHSLVVDKLGFDAKEFAPFDLKKLIQSTKGDKKAKDGKARYVLIEKIGKVKRKGKNFAHTMPDKMVEKIIKKLAL